MISSGHFVEDHLQREGLQHDEVMMALREHGVADVSGVEMAVLEVDATIGVIPRDTHSVRNRRRPRGQKPIG